MADQFPCPVPPKPPIARQHCRHYHYRHGRFPDIGGPVCAVGCDLSAPAASRACWPQDSTNGATCPKREEWTSEERAAWEAWSAHHRLRMIVAMQAIPRDGDDGEIQCPACGAGRIRYGRARSNGHLHAACSTSNCFAVMQ